MALYVRRNVESICFKSKMVQQPRFRPPRCCLFWKAIIFLLADKLRVSETFSDYSGNNFHEPASVVVFALVEPKRLFVQISEQVERLNAHVCPFDSALQERPEVFQPVCVDMAFRV